MRFIPSSSNIYPFGDKFKIFMANPVITKNISKIAPISLNWQDNAAVQALLDVVVGVMAKEYVRVARKNENVFKEIASAPSGPRNDGREEK